MHALSSNEIDTHGDIEIIKFKKYASVIIRSTSENAIKEFEQKLLDFLSIPSNIIINCAMIEDLSVEFIEKIKVFIEQLETFDKKLCLVFTSRPVIDKIIKRKDANQFLIEPTLLHAIKEFEEESKGSDRIHFIKAFADGAIKTFFIQAKTLCKREKILPQQGDLDNLHTEINGIINVMTEPDSYIIILGFPKQTFLNLMSRILGEQYTEVNDELLDGAKEFLNIIYGQARIAVNKNGKTLLNSQIPELINGNRFPGDQHVEKITAITESLSNGISIIVPFSSDLGPFNLTVWFPEKYDPKNLKK